MWCICAAEYYLAMKKKTTDTYFYMDGPQKHAKWKKSDVRHYTLYDSIYMKFKEKANLYTQRKIIHCLGLEGKMD